MKNRIIVAGNWKMNKTMAEAIAFFEAMESLSLNNVEAIIGLPAIFASQIKSKFPNSLVKLSLQNVSEKNNGAFTGEISASMIQSLDIPYCIVGHSERRSYYHETDELIFQKIKQCLAHQIIPIFCIGETLEERETEKTFEVIKKQLELGLGDLTLADAQKIYIAYEPVWAIGTGKTASTEQAQEVHLFIFEFLQEKYGVEIASQIPLLYGGSCNTSNAEALFSQPNIWGGLIGGASLDSHSFIELVDIGKKIIL
jgi:triosephosphate isomerase